MTEVGAGNRALGIQQALRVHELSQKWPGAAADPDSEGKQVDLLLDLDINHPGGLPRTSSVVREQSEMLTQVLVLAWFKRNTSRVHDQ